METLKYKIIKTESQYFRYCNALEEILDSGKKSRPTQDEIELLTFLIEKYDQEHNRFTDADPIELLKSLMTDHKMINRPYKLKSEHNRHLSNFRKKVPSFKSLSE